MTNKNDTKSLPPSVTIFRLADRPIVVKKASISKVWREVSKLTCMRRKYSKQESTSATSMPPTTGLGTEYFSKSGTFLRSQAPK
ncbi:unknown [Proteobacteria bacterium CAG:139]|nr:unknown [Proteobacteria bacterium CAG:139]